MLYIPIPRSSEEIWLYLCHQIQMETLLEKESHHNSQKEMKKIYLKNTKCTHIEKTDNANCRQDVMGM